MITNNPNNFTIETLEGTQYNMAELGLTVLSYRPALPEVVTQKEEIEGVDGSYTYGGHYGDREISTRMIFVGRDLYDYPLLRNLVFKYFYSRNPFYIIPDEQKGKRLLVRCSNSIDPDRFGDGAEIEVNFVSERLPWFESRGTSLDEKTFSSGLWSIGMGLYDDMPPYTYTNQTSFVIDNVGDVDIDPRQHSLVITFKGASTNLKIKNVTTNTEWTYAGSTTANDTIIIDCPNTEKNGLNIYPNTNRKDIGLVSGINNFTITGATAFTISFNFRFLYL